MEILNWRAKDNKAYSERAFERALELLDLTLDANEGLPRFKELARLREAMLDYFKGSNEFGSTTEASWRRYFMDLTYAARRHL